MKKTKSAVKYGIETLKVSPDELFKLIESSQGYNGSDYSRWLAGKIIDIADKDGIQFSQLLVKKFNIINELLEELSENQEIDDDYITIFKDCLNSNLYSINIDKLGVALKDVDWFNKIDLDKENSFFVTENLPLELQKNIFDNEKFSIIARLSLDTCDKKSCLYSDAKGQGIKLVSKGAMFLYRLCSLVGIFNLTECKFGLLVPTKFLYDEDNADIINYTLDYFDIETGLSIKSVEMLSNSINSGDIAFIVLTPRKRESQDGVILDVVEKDTSSLEGYNILCRKRYSKSKNRMIDDIKSSVVADEDSIAYLKCNDSVLSIVSSIENNDYLVPITKNTLSKAIVYYGVTIAKNIGWGDVLGLPCVIDGVSGYEELLYNCLPLFLFNYNSDMPQEVLNSDIIQNLVNVGNPYFSFEAKELYNLCMDFIKSSGVSDRSFSSIRKEISNRDFNNLYESKVESLKSYINSLSERFF